ncbi:MAG: 6-phosphofructokinase [Proteobacteria bacterium]|nr:MAG: 6-phosphofructokinase [Pseudomonadota bacterium]
MRTIGVLCSGGDAPGMNAALRAVVRYGISAGLRVYGITKGYAGLTRGSWKEMDRKSVANIILRGGTILKTDRCPEFHKKSVRKKAVEGMRNAGIDALVVIGGDGSFRGAHALWTEFGVPVVGIPGTIDNDIAGTEATLGFDTAVNNAIDAIDKIRDTASAHERTFLVEVMGRNSGYIALDVGIGGGAEAIILPEQKLPVREVAARIKRGLDRGKTSSIVVMAEGHESGGSMRLAEELKTRYGIEAKVCILGHIQRGGSPTARDRRLGSVMGVVAVKALLDGYTDVMVGVEGDSEVLVPIPQTVKRSAKIRKDLIRMAEILAT